MGASMKQPIIYCLRLLFFLHCCTFRSTLFPFQNKYSGQGYFGQKKCKFLKKTFGIWDDFFTNFVNLPIFKRKFKMIQQYIEPTIFLTLTCLNFFCKLDLR